MPRSSSTKSTQILLAMLRDARVEGNLTQAALAEHLELRQTDISKVERGVRAVTFLELRKWIQALHLPFTEFVQKLDERLNAQEEVERQAVRRVRPRPTE